MEDLSDRVERLKRLTARQTEVLGLLCAGLTYAQVAETLCITEIAVHKHVEKIYGNLAIDHLPRGARRIELGKFCSALDQLYHPGQAADGGVEPEQPQGNQHTPPVPLNGEAKTQASILQSINDLIGSSMPIVATAIILVGAITIGLLTTRLSNATHSPQEKLVETAAETAKQSSPVSSPTVMAFACGEGARLSAPPTDRFLRAQGVSAFTVENTMNAVLNNKARSVALDRRGLWVGYFSTLENAANGVGHYNKSTWANCNQPGDLKSDNVNAIAIDQSDRIWVAQENRGVLMYDGKSWQRYTTEDGLPSNITFGITVDSNNNIWVATHEGIGKFNGKVWTIPYSRSNNTLFSNHTHAIAFDSAGNIWVGHVEDGISRYQSADGRWIHDTSSPNGLGGNKVQSIAVRKADGQIPESIWVATEDGGISRFEAGGWTVYREGAIPSNNVRQIAIDKYNRVWAATAKGVSYYDGTRWVPYDSIDTYSIAFAPACATCPFEGGEHVWTGTATSGLTHSRLPYQKEAVDILDVRYPSVVKPGEKFRPEIVVAPRPPYQLREDRGDFLASIDESDAQRFGAYIHMAVKGTAEPGQPYTFTDYDNLFVAPQLAEGVNEQTYVSTWRVWMHTRYTGPQIRLRFTVQR